MLRSARMDAGLSREALAGAVLASAGLVQALEEEHRPPSETMADRISRALDLDPWTDAVLRAVAVDDAELRTRRGIRHVHRRSRTHSAAQEVCQARAITTDSRR
jgi:transcriptional regulator with XRE-family HTH domain